MNKLALSRWDPVQHLEAPADAVAYLDAAMEDGDPGLVAAVMSDVTKAIVEWGAQTDTDAQMDRDRQMKSFG